MNQSAFNQALGQLDYYISQLTSTQQLTVFAKLAAVVQRNTKGVPFPKEIEDDYQRRLLDASLCLPPSEIGTNIPTLFGVALVVEMTRRLLTQYMVTVKHVYTPNPHGLPQCDLCSKSAGEAPHL